MAEEKEVYTKKCKRCGNHFVTEGKKATVCLACKRGYKSIDKDKKTIEEMHAAGLPPISIKQIIRFMMKYNQKHNKSYSYGKFVEAMREGKIRVENL